MVLLVGNPTAQSGKARDRIQAALAAMRARGWDAQAMETLPGGATVQVLADRLDADDTVDTVVYLGGDGTFAEVAKGLLRAKRSRPMGMLPSGTANDQGKSFGITSKPDRLEWNLDVIEAGFQTRLDVGKVGRVGEDGRVDALDHVFHSVGFGLQSEILEQRNKDRVSVGAVPLLRDIYRDQLVYAGAAFGKLAESLIEPVQFDAYVQADGRRHILRGLTDLILNATPVYGGMWVPDRLAEPDDGRFELVPIHGRVEWLSKSVRDLASIPVWEEHLARFGIQHLDGFSASEFDVELVRLGRQEIATQIDGEEWVGGTHFKLSVLPRALPILTPAEWEPPWRPAQSMST